MKCRGGPVRPSPFGLEGRRTRRKYGTDAGERLRGEAEGILTSAAAVFAEQGMEKASMAQIANHSEVSKALLYHYYPSKDVLIFAIMHTHLLELEARSRPHRHRPLPGGAAAPSGGRGAPEIPGGGRCAQGAAHRHAALSDSSSEMQAIERQIVQRFAQVLRQINPDLDRPERPLLMPVTMSLFGMMNWVYMWFRDGGLVTREDYADVATTLILEGIKAVR